MTRSPSLQAEGVQGFPIAPSILLKELDMGILKLRKPNGKVGF